MARRLASAGYYVMLPNLYYRAGVMELGPLIGRPGSPERKRMFELMNSLDHPAGDGRHQGAARLRRRRPGRAARAAIGTVGYCMSGQYAINAAAALSGPGRGRGLDLWRAAGHRPGRQPAPGRRARPRPNSISAAPRPTTGRRWRWSSSCGHRWQTGVDAEVELYPGVEHGFAFPQRPAYNKDAAERHWERLLALYRRNLQA